MRKQCPETGRREIKRYLLSEMWATMSKSMDEGLERGLFAYKDPRTCALKVMERCRGTECAVAYKTPIEFFGGYDVIFHTHPQSSDRGGAMLSEVDIAGAAYMHYITGRRPLHCVADASPYGKEKTIRCWKTPVHLRNLVRQGRFTDHRMISDLVQSGMGDESIWKIPGEEAYFVLPSVRDAVVEMRKKWDKRPDIVFRKSLR